MIFFERVLDTMISKGIVPTVYKNSSHGKFSISECSKVDCADCQCYDECVGLFGNNLPDIAPEGFKELRSRRPELFV